ncbi:N-6 DNA methylase [Nocardia sp. NPDC051030]|uniref:HsdM family class I SAM-dependent methyltransferase n=1 Tax=Nocardia sp. NPDC051030 TaxID=3155162 RepID=UPI0034488DE2
MSDGPPLITAADISRYAGVTRATVSNWRRRHPDFPAIAGGTEARPLFDFDQVQAWLTARGMEAARSPLPELRTLVQAQVRPEDVMPLLGAVGVEHGKLVITGTPRRISEELSSAMRKVADADGARAVLEVLAERALQGGLEAGQYWTPPSLARLMADLLARPDGGYPSSVFDPACGRGGLLIGAARHSATQLYGQDVVPVQIELARLSVGLEVGVAPQVHVGDSLRADAFAGLQVDSVLCNPPFGQRDWGADDLRLDSRWVYGEPLRNDSELAWVQHGLAHLHPGGTAVFVLPPAVATRISGRRIRAALLRAGALRAVIALPSGTVPSTGLALQLWILRRPDTGESTPDRVLFVDAASTRESFDAYADQAVSIWRAFDTEPESFSAIPDIAAPVHVVTLLDDLVDLTPARYTRTPLDPQTLSKRIDTVLTELSVQVEALRTELGAVQRWPVAQQKSWRMATVSELAQGGALQVLRTAPKLGENTAVRDDGTRARPMMTGRDLVTGVRASETVGDLATSSNLVVIEVGDVLLPAVRGTRSDGVPVRVADATDAGVVAGSGVLVLRAKPDRLDPWFLAGFAASTENVTSSAISSTIRTETSRIRIPLLPLSEQGGYGAAFRRIHELRSVAHQAAGSADTLVGLVSSGLATGAVNPLDDEGRSRWSD